MTEKKNEKLLNKYIVTTNSFALNSFYLLFDTEVLSTSIFGIYSVPNVDVIRIKNLYFILVRNIYNMFCGFTIVAVLVKKGNTFSCITYYFGPLLTNSTSGTEQLISFLKTIPVLSISNATNEIAKTANLHLYANWLNLVSNSSTMSAKYLNAKKQLADFIMSLPEDSRRFESACSQFLVNILSKLSLMHLFNALIINFYNEVPIDNRVQLGSCMDCSSGYGNYTLGVGTRACVLIRYKDIRFYDPMFIGCRFGCGKYTGHNSYIFLSSNLPGDNHCNLRFIITGVPNSFNFSSKIKELETRLFTISNSQTSVPFTDIVTFQNSNTALPVLRNTVESLIYASLESFDVNSKLWRNVNECKFV